MKQEKQIVVFVVLFVVAAIIWFWYLERDKPTVTAGVVSVAQTYRLHSVENPQLHIDGLAAARKPEYKNAGRNIFSAIAPPPPSKEPDKEVPRREPVGPQPDPIPPPPTLPPNIRFFGYGTVPNGTPRRAFFTDGEDVHIVSEDEILLNRYRILKINNTNLEFEEISSSRRGTVMLEDKEPGPSS
jgi:hypothetical protein